jgi:C-terminal processing protease CtpA/Prc
VFRPLVGAGRLTAVVGEQPSAGTNGNITGVQLPGGFAFSYTGMRVLNPNGSRHHGIGIVPTVDTALSPADLRDGVDRDLLAAIEMLN